MYNCMSNLPVDTSNGLILTNMNDSQLEQQLHQAQVLVPHDNDVLLGRGALISKHPGNKWHRRLVQSNKELYRQCQKHDKLILAKNIVQMVHLRNPPGRFLEQSTGLWRPVSNAVAVRKTSQALREKTRMGQRAAVTNVAAQQMTSAHRAQEFRLLLPIVAQNARGPAQELRQLMPTSEAQNTLGDYSSAYLKSDVPTMVPQNLQPVSFSVLRPIKTRTDPILSPIERYTRSLVTTNSKTMEEKAPPESTSAHTSLKMVNDQFSLKGQKDGSHNRTFVRNTIDGPVEATQLLLPNDTRLGHPRGVDHIAFANQREAQFSQREVGASDLQLPSEERPRAQSENATASRQSGDETTSTSSNSRISAHVRRSPLSPCFDRIPSHFETRPSPFSSGRGSIDAPADPGKQTARIPQMSLPPSLLRQFRRHNVTPEVEPATMPQAELLLRSRYANQETFVSSIIDNLHNDTSYFSTKQAMSDDKKVEDNNNRLAPFVLGDGIIEINNNQIQSMESTLLQIPGDSGKGTSGGVDLRSRALELTFGAPFSNTTNSKSSPNEVDDTGSAHNKSNEIAPLSLARASSSVEDLWGTLSTSDERITHHEYDCASTFCSDANSNEGSPIGARGGIVNNAGRHTVSDGLSCSPAFEGINRLNSHLESQQPFEMIVGADLMLPLANASASNVDGNQSSNTCEDETAPRPH